MIAGAALALASGAAVAQATPAPTKFVFSGYWGWEVTRPRAEIPVPSHPKTRSAKGQVVGRQSSEPGGFKYPESVAVDNDPASPEYNDVYVADENNHRVQVFSPTGAFVSMFGIEVNETTKGNVCTEEEIKTSGVKCKAGMGGPAAGQFGEAGPESVAIDPASGNVYVTDEVDYYSSGRVFTGFGWRVQEFTAEGKFVLEIGKEVNETTEGQPLYPGGSRKTARSARAPRNSRSIPRMNGAANTAHSTCWERTMETCWLSVVPKTCCMSATNTACRSSRRTVNGRAKSH